jgi:hypothetical protein
MKFFKPFIVVFTLSLLSGLFLPWWTIAIIAFIVGFYLSSSNTVSFFSAFFALMLLWSGYALVLDIQNQSILSSKLAQLFSLPHPLLIVLVSGFISGLVAGFASLTGFLMRKVVIG